VNRVEGEAAHTAQRLDDQPLLGQHRVQHPIEPRQLHAQDGAEDFVDAEVHPREERRRDPRSVIAEDRTAVVEDERAVIERLVVRNERAALAARDDLVVVERKRSRVANRTQALAAIGTAIRLARIFEHFDAVLVGDGHNGIHIARQAIHVNGDDSFGARRDLARGVYRVERERRIHLSDDGHSAHRQRCECRRHKGVRRDDHLVARPHAHPHQPGDERRRPAGQRDGILRPNFRRPLRLEARRLALVAAEIAEQLLRFDNTL